MHIIFYQSVYVFVLTTFCLGSNYETILKSVILDRWYFFNQGGNILGQANVEG